MSKIIDLYEVLEPIFDIINKNKDKVEELIGDIEEDKEISDEDWEIVEEVGSTLDIIVPTIEEFRELIEKKCQ